MNTPPTMHNAPSMHWGLLLTASAMLMLTMGVRQTTGLFMAPIHESTGIGIASISFALAIGQFVWGAVQPVFGAIADKHGPMQVLVAGVRFWHRRTRHRSVVARVANMAGRARCVCYHWR